MTIAEWGAEYSGHLLLLFATGFGIGFLINMFRRYLEKI